MPAHDHLKAVAQSGLYYFLQNNGRKESCFCIMFRMANIFCNPFLDTCNCSSNGIVPHIPEAYQILLCQNLIESFKNF